MHQNWLRARMGALALACSLAAGVAAPPPAALAADGADPVTLNPAALKRIQRDLNAGGERRLRKNAKLTRDRLKAKVLGLKAPTRSRPAPPPEAGALDPALHRRLVEAALGSRGPVTTAVPTNVRHNDPSGDGPAAAQSEISLAIVGQYGLSSWNDGEGFNQPNSGRGQGVAYTTDGGATWTDVDAIPLGPGITDWVSDPVVAVNERTGEFWFCALTDDANGGTAGIGVIRATFPGGVFTWDTPHVVQNLSTNSHFLDKQWMVADSSNGNLYLSFTHFVVGGSSIGFQRSTDGGVTWSAEQTISSSSGDLQASRPAVAGDGTLYVTWKQIGPVDVDFVRVRRSTNQGVSFEPQNPGITFYDNFGSGAPGFNRNRNVVEPCPVVDRSFGPHRGRLYVVLHESLNFYDDIGPMGAAGPKSEPKLTLTSEVNNNFFARSVPFTAGQRLRGELRPAGDLDYWSFPAIQGTTYLFYADSLTQSSTGLLYTMRVFCGSDTATRLAYAGDVDLNGGGASFYAWTAPTTGTHYLRMAHVTGGASFGGYRIQTGLATRTTEVGRDQRDVVLHHSDDGGATWSGAKRINDDPAWYDDFLPEVGVTIDGHVYAAWYDWRDATSSCGGSSHTYVSRSLDGGDTWQTNVRVSSAPTAWTFAATNIQPNQGDYIGLYAGDRLALGWADGRTGETDVNAWGATVPVGFSVACPNDTTVTPNSSLEIAAGVVNENPLFANSYTWAASVDRGWPVTTPGNVIAAENGGVGSIPLTVSVPDTASGTAQVCVDVSLNGAVVEQCCFQVTAQGQAAVNAPGGARFAIRSLAPNPAASAVSVSFSLAQAGPVRLELIDLHGRRVASRDAGHLAPGVHTVGFGREIAALPAGVYAMKLAQNGRSIVRKLSIVR